MEEKNESNLTYGEKVAASAAEKVGLVFLYALLGVMGFCLVCLPFGKLWSYEFCCFIEKLASWGFPCLLGGFVACSNFCFQTCEKSIKRGK